MASPVLNILAIPPSRDPLIVWTDTKITRIFLSAIAGYSLIGARAMAGGLFPTTIVSFATASPFIVLSLAILWYATSLIDYQDMNTLQQVRKTCEKLPLSHILAKHGWENLFRFLLLDPKTLLTAYRTHATSLSFQEILDLYKESSNALCRVHTTTDYQIPHPSEWKQKFFQETKNATPEQILRDYSLSDLQSFEIVSKEQIAILKAISETLQQEKKEFREHLKNLSSLLEERIAKTSAYTQILQKGLSDLILFHSFSTDGFEDELKTLIDSQNKEYRTLQEKTESSLKMLYKSYVSREIASASSLPKRA